MKRLFKNLLLLLLLGCGDSAGGNLSTDASTIDTNDASTVSAGPCELDVVRIEDGDHIYEIFRYEAARDSNGDACSQAGRLPWHSIRQGDALEACEQIGWRLCALEEITRACQGLENRRYPYGSRLVAGRCNIRDAYVVPGEAQSSVAPAGYFSACVSQDGVFDMTGNLWEWVAVEDDTYRYFGSGFRFIAERHRDEDHSCESYVTLPAVVGEPYFKDTVGFRCCRDVD